MPATLKTCSLLAKVLAPVVESDCTVVVNGVNTLPKGDPGHQADRAVYTRWGRTLCPLGATLVYADRAAGAKYNMKGGTSDILCMPETPQYLSTDTTASFAALLHGVKIQTQGMASTPLNNVLHADMPCTVCHTNTKQSFSLSLLSIPVLTGGAWSTPVT